MLPSQPATMKGVYEAVEAVPGQPSFYVHEEAPTGRCSTPAGLGELPLLPAGVS